MYFYSVENVIGLTSVLFTRSEDADVLLTGSTGRQPQSPRAAEHTTSQQVAWAEQTRLGRWGKGLKIAAKEYQTVHSWLIDATDLSYISWSEA